ncbi:hypothetical protein ACFM35_00850 [Microbacterium sp. P01]|uniref:hypothetical protein n=1 Tax=Microbacterium sp. P01 TaxID=3366261 RepID=UPI003673452B
MSFATEMAQRMGKGWQRQEVYKVQRGDRVLTSDELMAAALVLGCTVSELIASDDAVQIGTQSVGPSELADALTRPSPEIDGWARLQDAGEALAEVRAAWMRYTNTIDIVRHRIEASDALRERVEAFQAEALRGTAEQLLAAESDDAAHSRILEAERLRDAGDDDAAHALMLGSATPARLSRADIATNATPQVWAAVDALATTDLPARVWAWRGDRNEPAQPKTTGAAGVASATEKGDRDGDGSERGR